MNTSYSLSPSTVVFGDDADDALMNHLPNWLVADYDEMADEGYREFTIADAMAASGDYFVTLATRLDKLAQGLPQDSAEQIELEHQVKTLLYMQEHYDLIGKAHRRRPL